MQSQSTPLLGLEAPDLERMAIEAGAKLVEFFGGYGEELYEPRGERGPGDARAEIGNSRGLTAPEVRTDIVRGLLAPAI